MKDLPRWVWPLARLTTTILALLPLVRSCASSGRARCPRAPRIHLIQDMDSQPRYKPQAESPLFADGRAMRPPVAGTVEARPSCDNPALTTGKAGERWDDVLPVTADEVRLARGGSGTRSSTRVPRGIRERRRPGVEARRDAGRGDVGAAQLPAHRPEPGPARRADLRHDQPGRAEHAVLRRPDRRARPLGDRRPRARPAAQPACAARRRAGRPRTNLIRDRNEHTGHRAGRTAAGAGAERLWRAAAGVGLAGIVVSVGLAFSRLGFTRLAFAYLTSFAWGLSLALGALFFIILQHLTRAGWSVVVRRLAEGVASTLPFWTVMAVPVLAFVPLLYHWSHRDVVAADRCCRPSPPTSMCRSSSCAWSCFSRCGSG